MNGSPLEKAKEDAKIVLLKWPSRSDVDKDNRAFSGYDLGLVPLRLIYSRADALRVLDKMFGVSERHVRRVETIRKSGKAKASILERIARAGHLSLETLEHLVIKPTNADVIEAIWVCASESEQAEFLRRIGK